MRVELGSNLVNLLKAYYREKERFTDKTVKYIKGKGYCGLNKCSF